MEPIHPDEMVPDTKYTMENPKAVSLVESLKKLGINEEVSIYKTVTFKRVAYKLNGLWNYQFDVDGRKRYFTSNDTFYK